MRAFCYCRVSTEEQTTDDHYSLGNQEKKAKDYAKVKDWKMVKIRKDVGSGKDSGLGCQARQLGYLYGRST